MIAAIWHKILCFLLGISCIAAPIAPVTVSPDQEIKLGTANTKIRQEINILDGYLTSASGVTATSSEIVLLDDSKYTGPTFYFEVVASTTAATNAPIYLANATSSKIIATVTANGTGAQLLRSSAFSPTSSTTEYKVVASNAAVGKSVAAARIVVLQNSGSGDLNSTQTQIEIGSNVIATSSTATTPMSNPKYWYYDSANWDGSPTFYAEVSYMTTMVASSTFYRASATTTQTTFTNGYKVSPGAGYTVIEAWGGGGGGGIRNGVGGGGGTGGGYALSTTTPAIGSLHTIVAGQAGVADDVTPMDCTTAGSGTATNSTYDSSVVVGGAGKSSSDENAATGQATQCPNTGQFTAAGGDGGQGLTTDDTGGGGGGAGGPNGPGGTGANGSATDGGGGGEGNGGANGSGTTGGSGGPGGDGGNELLAGKDAVTGGGGGGGGDQAADGGAGGKPGGGGGGAEQVTSPNSNGGAGQVKITEYIGTVGIALEESDGTGDGFTGWAFKKQIVTAGNQIASSTRVRSTSFTPTSGRNYRLVASTTSATASYDIYNAKIIVNQSASPIDDSYNESNWSFTSAICAAPSCSGQGRGQSFTSTGGTLDSVKFYLQKNATPTGNAVAKLYAVSGTLGTDSIPTGAALATSDNLDVSTVSTSLGLVTLTFSGANRYALVGGTSYVISIEYSGGGGGSTLGVGWDAAAPTHYGNISSLESGVWTGSSSIDAVFYVYLEGSAPTRLEPQYLLAPQKIAAGTNLQNYLTKWDSTEWSTTNAYYHEVQAANGDGSVAEVDTAAGVQLTNSVVTSPDNRGRSASMCMPSSGDLDVKATTNSGNIYSSRIIVAVGLSDTPVCGAAAPTVAPAVNSGIINVSGVVNISN